MFCPVCRQPMKKMGPDDFFCSRCVDMQQPAVEAKPKKKAAPKKKAKKK